MRKLEKKIIDFNKLQRLADELKCDIDDLFEWTDLPPMKFMEQIGSIAGFDVKEFLKTDVEELDFKNIMTDSGRLKKMLNLSPKYRSIENVINLELGLPLRKKENTNSKK
ncbi:MAG: hypothetical protein OXB88_04150, partial [Bacteriovoracales bacterium]|nr:hypothetical protein [Bacteriovoracales bacterium]